jgi:DnaJ-class molecular chaperone
MRSKNKNTSHAIILVKVARQPTKRAADKCPACRGSGIEKANKKYTVYCVACNGWGIRR